LGGGGYFGGINTSRDTSGENIEELEKIAREKIRERKPLPPRRNVFISFRIADEDAVNDLRKQARDENSELNFTDYSLRQPFDSEDATYIRRGIRKRIENCSVTIVVIGETTHESEWIDWEIKESLRLGKGVIAIKLKEGVRMPQALIEHGITPIPNNPTEISQAIQEVSENR